MLDNQVNKLISGIAGFDLIANGGVPKGRTTLVVGTAGSAKTVFAAQFLANGIQNRGETGVFVTFEEEPDDIRNNLLSFGWDIRAWEVEHRWYFVDASPQPEGDIIEAGYYDLGALLARIEYAIKQINAQRVVMDSLGAIFTQLTDSTIIRRELFRIASALKHLQVTAIMTAERIEEYGPISRYGVEEFVTDNVVILRNVLEDEKRRRTIEILKFRGTTHQKGEFPFTITPEQGVVVIPLSAIELKQLSSDIRLNSGNDVLDQMCGGGFFRDSVILISGATGTGKTLMVNEFINNGAQNGERCLLLAFEESQAQLFRNATGWGFDFKQLEQQGTLKVVCQYPESVVLDEHLIYIKNEIERFKPQRVAIDSLSALERVATIKGFREFVISLTSSIKHQEIVGLFTATTPTLMGGSSVTEAHISTITDSIILLRYVEIYGEMRRGITILKMRGSKHDKDIREFTIDHQGMHIGKAFRNVTGILSGHLVYTPAEEMERMNELFKPSST